MLLSASGRYTMGSPSFVEVFELLIVSRRETVRFVNGSNTKVFPAVPSGSSKRLLCGSTPILTVLVPPWAWKVVRVFAWVISSWKVIFRLTRTMMTVG